ncbi:MAG: polysaccharide deacetylase family protein, partial [Victivallaceae bacterium]
MNNLPLTICDSPAGNKGMLCFTFDDGTLDHLQVAAPELEKRNWYGTFFINTRSNDRPAGCRLTRRQIAEMSQRGHEIALHTVTHRPPSGLAQAEDWGALAWEIAENIRELANITGLRPRTYTAPYSDYPPFMNKILQQKQILATPERCWIDSMAKLELDCEKFTAPQAFTVLGFHGVAPGFGAWGAPEERNFFPGVLDFFKSLEENIYIGTFDEIGS